MGEQWISTAAGVMRMERGMKDLRKEIGTECCLVGEIVKSRMKWTHGLDKRRDTVKKILDKEASEN